MNASVAVCSKGLTKHSNAYYSCNAERSESYEWSASDTDDIVIVVGRHSAAVQRLLAALSEQGTITAVQLILTFRVKQRKPAP